MPFVKGVPQTHNRRGGRPKGFRGVAKMIMRETRDGRDLVEYALKIWRDESEFDHKRWQAFEWLADRAIGRPMLMMDLDAALQTSDAPPRQVGIERLAALDPAQRSALRAAILALRGDSPPLPVIDVPADEETGE